MYKLYDWYLNYYENDAQKEYHISTLINFNLQ